VIKLNENIIYAIKDDMEPYLNQKQLIILHKVLKKYCKNEEFTTKTYTRNEINKNKKIIELFLFSKKVEGCSEKTIEYYQTTIQKMLETINKPAAHITTKDIRDYIGQYRTKNKVSKTTADNIRRILSSFFAWLEDEDYILKNPVRRIKKIKKGKIVKETLTDENIVILRDNCENIRDLAIIDLLISTGMRVGELVNLNREDIDFYERECIVFGKGESERVVYFDAKTKIHLKNYLKTRTDNNPALFVSLKQPYKRLGTNGVERRLRNLGQKTKIKKVHPHKFRRTLATNAIDKGMPIEQVQKLLGHVQIDTTMEYAMVKQNNVKNSHKKYIS